jgi:hypothetical protein
MSGIFPGNSSLIQQLDSAYLESIRLAVPLLLLVQR